MIEINHTELTLCKRHGSVAQVEPIDTHLFSNRRKYLSGSDAEASLDTIKHAVNVEELKQCVGSLALSLCMRTAALQPKGTYYFYSTDNLKFFKAAFVLCKTEQAAVYTLDFCGIKSGPDWEGPRIGLEFPCQQQNGNKDVYGCLTYENSHSFLEDRQAALDERLQSVATLLGRNLAHELDYVYFGFDESYNRKQASQTLAS